MLFVFKKFKKMYRKEVKVYLFIKLKKIFAPFRAWYTELSVFQYFDSVRLTNWSKRSCVKFTSRWSCEERSRAI